MKIETKFGLGEIVFIMDGASHNQNIPDLIGQITAIQTSKNGHEYLVEIAADTHPVQRIHYQEWQLTGDPAYDQDAGAYPANMDNDA